MNWAVMKTSSIILGQSLDKGRLPPSWLRRIDD